MYKTTSPSKKAPKTGLHIKLGMRMKLFFVIFILVAAAVTVFAVMGILQFSWFGELIYESNMEQDEIISDTTDRTMFDATMDSFQKYIKSDAAIIDKEFWTMEDDLNLLAVSVQDVLENPENYGEARINVPDACEAGKIACQLLYSNDADESVSGGDIKIKKLANLGPSTEYIVRGREVMHDVVIAIPEGACIVTDRHPEDKVTDDGSILPYDVRSRPDYNGAVSTGKPFFAPLIFDEHHGHYKVSLGIPVYVDGELAAFVGGSRFLSDLDDMIREMSADVGEDSFVCLASDTGSIIFSEREEGELGFDGKETRSILDPSNPELAALGQKAVAGENGFGSAVLDGKTTFLAYAPLETVGWTMILGVTEDTLKQPSRELVAGVDAITADTLKKTSKMSERMRTALLLTAAGLIFLSVFTSLRYSRKLIRPIRVLKDAGSRFIGRDEIDLLNTRDFFADLDLYTGDETEELWLTMKDLEQNIKTSVSRLKEMTAEKERIDTELSVAARLQSDMLPKTFPAFPDRKDFDLFSFMKPAKEVGGDFYDFFLADEDHLVLIMADVSGKGVPAALFMVVARTMIKNLSLSEGCGSPGKILETVNNNLCENNDECMFVTVWLGCITLSTGELKWANAGHEYPAVCRAGGDFELIKDIHGPGLGTFEDVTFEEQEITLAKGDLLFLYTDGIPEATDGEGIIFGTEMMIDALNKCRKEKELRNMAASVKSSVDAFVKNAPQFDDITMTFLEYKGI